MMSPEEKVSNSKKQADNKKTKNNRARLALLATFLALGASAVSHNLPQQPSGHVPSSSNNKQQQQHSSHDMPRPRRFSDHTQQVHEEDAAPARSLICVTKVFTNLNSRFEGDLSVTEFDMTAHGNCSFLSNAFDMSGGPLIYLSFENAIHAFATAEAAYQALKLPQFASQIAKLSAANAKRFAPCANCNLPNDEQKWRAMKSVLHKKFQIPQYSKALQDTGTSFILAHMSQPRDNQGFKELWSDNHFGSGKNWIGILLMLLRDDLNITNSNHDWRTWLKEFCAFNEDTGQFETVAGEEAWQNLVTKVAQAVNRDSHREPQQHTQLPMRLSLEQQLSYPVEQRQKIQEMNIQGGNFIMECSSGRRYAFTFESLVVPVVAFYYPGKRETWDTICGCGFLGNFWEVMHGMSVKPNELASHNFTNAEAAFQALKFWNFASVFSGKTGQEAFQLKQKYNGQEDWTYAGYGNNWQGMIAVLRVKFAAGTEMMRGLLVTKNDYLLEHNVREGRDKIWSDNCRGDGMNWLGMQLMIIRGECLAKNHPHAPNTWYDYLQQWTDINTGEFKHVKGKELWLQTVKSAAEAVRNNIMYNSNNS